MLQDLQWDGCRKETDYYEKSYGSRRNSDFRDTQVDIKDNSWSVEAGLRTCQNNSSSIRYGGKGISFIRKNGHILRGGRIMAKVFITLTGTKHYFGNDFLKKGTKIRLEKEPDNEYDKEAIKVTYEGLGKIGYVANSSYTVIGDSMSAGRLYDKIGKTAYAKVELVTPAGTICKVCKKSLKNEMKETMNDEK